MVRTYIQRRGLRTLTLTGASLIALQAMAGTMASAQEANVPTRGNASSGASVQLNELSVESQGVGDRYGPVSSSRPGPGQVENPNGPISGFVAKRSATALKTNTPLLETPQSISVVGRQQLDAQNAQNLSQATQYVAGTYASPFGYDTRLDYFLLRGFNASDYGLYLNGLQTLNYGFGYFRYNTFGLERVEVLRGPASVLFGAGSPGGIINQVSKRPTYDPFGYVEVGGGSYGQKYTAFDFGGPADKEGHWFFRLTGYGRNGGTQIDGLSDNSFSIAPAVTYKPDGATTFTVLTALQHDTTGVSANFLPYVGSVRAQAFGLRIPRSLNVGDPNLNSFRRDQAFLGYEFEHVFNDTWTIRQNMRYSFGDTFQNSYIGNSFTGGLTGPTQTDLSRYQFLVKDRVNIFQVDNQAEARFFDGYFRHDLLMGLDYKDYRLSDNQSTNFSANPFYSVPDLNILSPISTPALGTPLPYLVNFNTFKQLGIYLQDQIKLNDQLTLLLGGRQDFADNRINDKLTNGLTSNGRSDNGTTYRLALIYNFDYGLAPYVSYSTSFQPLLGTDINNQGFKPETGKQIEGGIKFEPIGQNYLLTLAGFDIHRRNTLTADPSNPFFQVQLGEVRSTGFEAQLQASVYDGLNVGASYTIYGLTNERNSNASLIGKVPVNTPENFANVFVDYTIPFGELRGLGFGGGVRYIGRSFADQANLFHVPEYVLFDAQVHYNWDRWRFQVNATNIADRRFVSSCQSVNACFYGQARQVLGSISYRW